MATPPARDVTSDRPPLSRDRIVENAIALVDAEGIEALSMRRLGTALGVEAMSIYNYFASKADLIDGVTEHVIAEIAIPADGGDWRQQAKEMARSYRRIGHAHPNIAPLIAMRPLSDLPALRPVEVALELLESAGFRGPDALQALRTLAAYASGFILAETGGFFGDAAGRSIAPGTEAISPQEFPYLVAIQEHLTAIDEDQQFELGLDVILDGLEARLQK